MFLKLVEVNQRMNTDIEGIKKENEKLTKALYKSLDAQEVMRQELDSLKEKIDCMQTNNIFHLP